MELCNRCGRPTIATFNFRGKERWCPGCGATYELYNSCVQIKPTEERQAEQDAIYQKAAPFLQAQGIIYGRAIATEIDGKKVAVADLTDEQRAHFQELADNSWDYPEKVFI